MEGPEAEMIPTQLRRKTEMPHREEKWLAGAVWSTVRRGKTRVGTYDPTRRVQLLCRLVREQESVRAGDEPLEPAPASIALLQHPGACGLTASLPTPTAHTRCLRAA